MRSTLILALLCAFFIGCGDGERGNRRERRRNRDDQEIVKPIDNGTLTAAQFTQAKARADGLRELAAQFRAGDLKTMYDAKDAYVKLDHAAREAFDKAFNSRMKREFDSKMDEKSTLPSDSDKIFESIADELDKASK